MTDSTSRIRSLYAGRALAVRTAAAVATRTLLHDFAEWLMQAGTALARATAEQIERGLILGADAFGDARAVALAWALPRRRTLTVIAAVTALLLTVTSLIVLEVRTSWLEAHLLARYAQEATFRVEPGPARQIRFPTTGPYDERLGYTRVPDMTAGLAKRGFEITRQARDLADPDRPELVFPLYHEKTTAGLTVQDPSGHLLYQARYPRRTYPDYDSIPAVIVRSLVFLENRELLEETGRFQNPAIEWDRLAAASGNLAVGRLLGREHVFGGSTLATQMEKFRHSPDGLTQSPLDKMQQLVSASARAYLDGPQTEETRHRIVTDYVNSVPLGAVPGFGEVIGMADGLYAWFGQDYGRVNRLLARADQFQVVGDEEARAFRATLSLLVALRRPAFYFAGYQGRAALDREVDIQARLLLREGIISPLLGQTVLGVKVALRSRAPDEVQPSFVDRKAANLVRTQLLGLFAAPSLPALDRYDVTVRSTVDSAAQQAVTARLLSLRDPAEVRALGLDSPRQLGHNDPGAVGYSFILYERTPSGSALRVQADNLDVPFDLNRGARLELGSTAKVRTMVTYLEILDDLHRQLAAGTLDQPLAAAASNAGDDSLTRWAIEYHRRHPGHTRQEMLEAALDRRYSASPHQRFFTGGGIHEFVNFDSRFDDSVMTVRDALANSVNLVFIRLLGDVVRYYVHRLPDVSAEMLADPSHPARQAYLARFVESDSRAWLRRFYNRYRGMERDRLVDSLSEIRRVHPLDLWVAKYLRDHPDASWDVVVRASESARRQAYGWLLDDTGRANQRALDIALEQEAFERIQESWSRLGYPYEDLVPSLATTIGSSGDRPDALAELMGILVNDGVRMPQLAMDQVHFAEGTPYETAMRWKGEPADFVLSPEVAAAARGALTGVVTSGTAAVLRGALRTADDRDIPIGGKTGTGQNEYKVFGPGLRVAETRSVSRTATFVFFIGDRFFGTITAHVTGPESARYQFTSALPVKLFGVLLKDLKPMLDEAFEWRSMATGTFSMN